MKRRAHLVGLTYAGESYALPECANDAQGMSDILRARPYSVWQTLVTARPVEKWETLCRQSLDYLSGADVAVLLHSMHGFWQQANGKRESGIWPGEPVPHRRVLHELIEPLCARCGTVVYILDSCYSGGARRAGAAKAQGEQTENVELSTKCLSLTDTSDAVSDPGALDTIDVPNKRLQNYAVIAACGRRQNAFGAFRGRFGSMHGMSTHEHSLHTYNLVGALVATSFLSLKLSLQYMTFKNKSACDAFAPYEWWHGRGWKVPTCTARIGKLVPDNVLA